MSRRARTRPRDEKSEQSGFHPRRVSHRTPGQKEYIKRIFASEITIGIGPAGTGKTHCAIGCAVSLMRDGHIEKLVLTRPAVDSGSSIGFLPGTLEEKMNPFMRPLYDELEYFVDPKLLKAWVEHGRLEIVPLAYMRGRTFNNTFIIVDEAQNALHRELKMCMTRIGMYSKLVVSGDLTQSDLLREEQGALENAYRRLERVRGISTIELTADDIVRNPIIGEIEAVL